MSGGLKVLCVDDENMALGMLMALCKKIEIISDIVGFTSAELSLEYAKDHFFDVALLDIDMPVLDGLTLGEKLRELMPYINIIIVSAYPDYALQAYRFDCSGYLVKPIHEEELRHQINVLRFPVSNTSLHIRTFGNFEIFFRDKPVHFAYQKSKETLALLVLKKGSGCSNQELATYLWEDDKDHSSYIKRIKRDITDTFEKLVEGNVCYFGHGQISLNTSAVSCDYLDNPEEFQGEFMEQYSWAEETKAELLAERRNRE